MVESAISHTVQETVKSERLTGAVFSLFPFSSSKTIRLRPSEWDIKRETYCQFTRENSQILKRPTEKPPNKIKRQYRETTTLQHRCRSSLFWPISAPIATSMPGSLTTNTYRLYSQRRSALTTDIQQYFDARNETESGTHASNGTYSRTTSQTGGSSIGVVGEPRCLKVNETLNEKTVRNFCDPQNTHISPIIQYQGYF